MSSTEEDTYKKLKGLTQDEAIAIFASAYVKLAEELGKAGGDLPIYLVRNVVDAELNPYGWSYDRIFEGILDELN
jgi:hypothetical protein